MRVVRSSTLLSREFEHPCEHSMQSTQIEFNRQKNTNNTRKQTKKMEKYTATAAAEETTDAKPELVVHVAKTLEGVSDTRTAICLCWFA